jgi:hypothetical protein
MILPQHHKLLNIKYDGNDHIRKLKGMGQKAVMIYYKTLSWHLVKKNHEKSVRMAACIPAAIQTWYLSNI